jgi:hypothetical protein
LIYFPHFQVESLALNIASQLLVRVHSVLLKVIFLKWISFSGEVRGGIHSQMKWSGSNNPGFLARNVWCHLRQEESLYLLLWLYQSGTRIAMVLFSHSGVPTYV